MIFKCLENDVVIEYNKKNEELYISCEGETSKTIVGVVDITMALEKFKLCKVQRSVRGNFLIDQSLPIQKQNENR